MGEDLHGELVSVSEEHGRLPSSADTRGRARDDDGSLGQGRAGRDEAHNLGHGEDQIALGEGRLAQLTLTADGDTWARAEKEEEKGARKQQ